MTLKGKHMKTIFFAIFGDMEFIDKVCTIHKVYEVRTYQSVHDMEKDLDTEEMFSPRTYDGYVCPQTYAGQIIFK